MKTDCLSERDLLLLHYGEAPDGTSAAGAAAHLAVCADCRLHRERLAAELDRIPTIPDPDPVVATRIAARVSERLQQGTARRWLPALGGAAVATVALAVTFALWLPQPGVEQTGQPATPSVVALSLEEEMPDLDFLEDLELIEELELLQQIEGV